MLVGLALGKGSVTVAWERHINFFAECSTKVITKVVDKLCTKLSLPSVIEVQTLGKELCSDSEYCVLKTSTNKLFSKS